MEKDTVFIMVRETLKTKEIRTSTIIGDGDSISISRLSHEIDPKIEKRLQRNQVGKILAYLKGTPFAEHLAVERYHDLVFRLTYVVTRN